MRKGLPAARASRCTWSRLPSRYRPIGARARGRSMRWSRSWCAHAPRNTCGDTTATSGRPVRRRPGAPRPDMRVLLLGAGGFIGREVFATLAARGHRVVAAVRDIASAPPFATEPAIAIDMNTDIDVAAWLPRLAGIEA